ncbi:MAG TPA: alpha-glucosidase C-terminal domain-containing protein, partial [Jatrophihabitans sp.]|nr:alpha-glucosidase C-terminal domain-containing protein [Jatrophihabitans sp.]
TFTDLGGSNPCVLSFIRSFGDDIVLCVNNLSRFPQAVELDLRPWEGAEPIEMTGGSRFPAIGELPYLLTVAGHGFYWLRIPAHQVKGGTGLPASEGTEPRSQEEWLAEEQQVAHAEQAARIPSRPPIERPPEATEQSPGPAGTPAGPTEGGSA